jgi:hypothetical protein
MAGPIATCLEATLLASRATKLGCLHANAGTTTASFNAGGLSSAVTNRLNEAPRRELSILNGEDELPFAVLHHEDRESEQGFWIYRLARVQRVVEITSAPANAPFF